MKLAHGAGAHRPSGRGGRNEKPTDVGNARRLVARWGHDLRYCAARGGWFVWDERRWRLDQVGEPMRLAQETIRHIYAEAAKIEDEESTRGELVRHALDSERCERLRAMLKLAQSDPRIAVEAKGFDSEPTLLNCVNGILDLRTGLLQLHERSRLITKLAPVVYDEGARSETWEGFLARIFGENEELIDFVQRAVGYTLLGDPREEVLFLCHGPKQTGKSTFLETLKAVLGEYGASAAFDSFLHLRGRTGPRNDLARLAGIRMVIAGEAPAGQQFDEALVKLLTGGDTITARFLHREHFEYRPQFTIWLAGNHRPRVRDDDDAIWRRIRLIPFLVEVPDSERDPGLKARLRDPELSGRGVLRWVVEGCRKYRRYGLGIPEVVRAATAAYREEMALFSQFVEDHFVLDPEGWEPSESVAIVYRRYCAIQRNDYPLGPRGLAERLRARGCASRKRRGVRGWQGLRLLEPGARADTLGS